MTNSSRAVRPCDSQKQTFISKWRLTPISINGTKAEYFLRLFPINLLPVFISCPVGSYFLSNCIPAKGTRLHWSINSQQNKSWKPFWKVFSVSISNLKPGKNISSVFFHLKAKSCEVTNTKAQLINRRATAQFHCGT